MIHQPSMQFQGAAEDVRRTAEEVLKIKEKINQMYADETGQDFEKSVVFSWHGTADLGTVSVEVVEP